MQILIIDTHSRLSSVGIMEDKELIGEMSIDEAYTHSDHLLPMIKDLFIRTGRELVQMDGFAVCAGPGSFTGLRIGMTTAKTFAQLMQKPVVGISTLAALADTVLTEKTIIPIVDGRGGNVYYGEYQRKGLELIQTGPYGFGAMEEMVDREAIFVGQDTRLFPEIANRSAPLPLSSLIAPLGRLAIKRLVQGEDDGAYALIPNYLRLSQAQRDYFEKHHEVI